MATVQNLEEDVSAEALLGDNPSHGTPSSTDSGLAGEEIVQSQTNEVRGKEAGKGEAVVGAEFGDQLEESDEKISVDIEEEPFIYRRESKNDAEDAENNSASPSSANNEEGQVINITCGVLAAKLHMDRFMCPGIHQPCVEYDGEFYSPKQFTVVAAKDKQKDWKGSIKIDRVPLRSLMERKQLDFYKHEKYCSGKCASKNYRAMYKDQEFQFSTAEFIQQQQQALFSGSMTLANSVPASNSFVTVANFVPELNNLIQATANLVKNEPNRRPTGISADLHLEGPNAAPSRLPRSISMVDPPTMVMGDSAGILSSMSRNFPGISSLEGSGLASPTSTAGNSGTSRTQSTSSSGPRSPDIAGPEGLLLERPFQFWQNVFHLGLFDDLVLEIISQLEQYKVLFASRPELREKISERLSSTVRSLDISQHVARTLQTKRILTKAETDILTNEIEELKRRTDEQKRRQLEAKRKSELFDQLFQKSAKSAKIMDGLQ